MANIIAQINNLVINLKKNNPLIKCGNISIVILKYLKFNLKYNNEIAQIFYIESARNWSLQKFKATQFNELYNSL